MSKKVLLLLVVGLVCGLVGIAHAGTTATITVTASVATSASISPGTTTYAFGASLNYGTTYHGSPKLPLTFTNDGAVSETLQIKHNQDSSWTYATAGDMSSAPTGDDNAKIGGNWGASASEVPSMILITNADGVQSASVTATNSLYLWLGIYTPESLSTSTKSDGQVTLTVTATMD